MARSGLAAALLAALLVAGCGGTAGDLIAIEVSGGPARERGPLEIVVADNGRASCNRGEAETLPSDLLIEARELERELGDLAEQGANYPGGGGDQRQYVARTRAGTVRWAEGVRDLPPVLPRAQLLALRLDRLLCTGTEPFLSGPEP